MPVKKRTKQMEEQILQALEKGTTLTKACENAGIRRSTWHRWVADDEELAGRFAHAKQSGIHAMAEQCLEIADEEDQDVQRSKLRVDTRLKLLACWDSKNYGTKQELNHAGGIEVKVVKNWE